MWATEEKIITRLSGEEAEDALPGLIALHQDAVASGASVGFLAPLDAPVARAYWEGVCADVRRGACVLLVARQGDDLIGTIHLALATKPNARHRAEVCKLLVHRKARRQGLGRQLLDAVEREARAEERTLLVLDTRQGDDAERLYRRYGYTEAGIIPCYARATSGALDATVFFYRILGALSTPKNA